jgi:Flp pilus assembly protein TadG
MTINRFKSDESGNVAIVFSIAMFGLLSVLGVGLDYTNMVKTQTTLQAQVDFAALAAATVTIDSENDASTNKNIREEAAYQVIKANGYENAEVRPTVEINDESVIVTATINYPTMFGRFIGQENVIIKAEAESGMPSVKGVDIVLALDNTDSMRVSGKMTALKAGAVRLVDAIEESGSDSKVAIVPFARYVGVHPDLKDESWLSVPEEFTTERTYQQATHSGGTCRTETRTREVDGVEEEYETEVCENQETTYEERTRIIESRWIGCVGTRSYPLNERDGSYTTPIEGLLDPIPHEIIPGHNTDRRAFCPTAITPLTTDYTELRTQINRMFTTDNTYLPAGLIWGQRVLSPGLPFDNVQDNPENPNRKVLVFMTDGNNTTFINDNANAREVLKAPPRIDGVNFEEGETAIETDRTTARLCESIKADGTEIYTVAFQVESQTARTLLRNCAS